MANRNDSKRATFFKMKSENINVNCIKMFEKATYCWYK